MSQLHRCFRGIYAGTVLLHRVLRVANLDANLVLDLLETHLGLTVFQFGANLYGLRSPVTQGNVQLKANAFVGSSGVDELVQSAAITSGGRDRTLVQGRVRVAGRAEWLRGRHALGRWILRASQARTAVIGEEIQARQQGTAYRFVAELATVEVDAGLHQFRSMAEGLVDQVVGGNNWLLGWHVHGGDWNNLSGGQYWILQRAREGVLHQQL